jgi:hypothetical protein
MLPRVLPQWVMVSVSLLALLWLAAPHTAMAQGAVAPAKEEPATKFERFLLTKGSVVVREYYNIGSISSRFGGSASFQVARMYTPGSTNYVMALRIEVKEGGRLERERIGVLDREEVASLANAIPQMAKMAETLRQSQGPSQGEGSTEVVFGGGSLRFTAFVGRVKGEGGLAIEAGTIGSTQVFLDLADLSRVGTLASQAVSKMQALDQKR